MRATLAPVAIALIILPTACQRTSVSERKKASLEQGSGTRAVPVDSSQRQEKGEHTEGGEEPPPITQALPENFPRDVPVYPSAEPVASMVNEGELNIGFRTTDPLTQVVKFYQDSLSANGWRIEMTEIPGGETVLRGQKRDRRCEVSIAESESVTLIGITVSRGDISPENEGVRSRESEAGSDKQAFSPRSLAPSRRFS